MFLCMEALALPYLSQMLSYLHISGQLQITIPYCLAFVVTQICYFTAASVTSCLVNVAKLENFRPCPSTFSGHCGSKDKYFVGSRAMLQLTRPDPNKLLNNVM